MTSPFTVELQPDEVQALYSATFYVTGGFGAPPDPPTAAMRAQEKLAKLLGEGGTCES